MIDNNNECPKSIDDLVAQKYLPKKQKDPWGKDFIMHCPGTINTDGADVVSAGPDKQGRHRRRHQVRRAVSRRGTDGTDARRRPPARAAARLHARSR